MPDAAPTYRYLTLAAAFAAVAIAIFVFVAWWVGRSNNVPVSDEARTPVTDEQKSSVMQQLSANAHAPARTEDAARVFTELHASNKSETSDEAKTKIMQSLQTN